MEKRLPTLGVEITWLMRSIGTSVRLRRALWRYSDVILLPSLTNVRRGRLVLEYLLLALLAPLLMMQIARLRPKAVFVRNDPVYLGFALATRLLTRTPVIFQLSHLKEEDLLARSEAAHGFAAISLRWKGRIARALRNFLIVRVDRVLAISPAMQEVLAAQCSVLPPVSIFPLGVDVGVENEAPDADAKVRFERYVIYVGTMARTRQPEAMVDAIALVRRAHPEVGLVLVGGGGEPQERERLRQYVVDAGAGSFVQFVPDVPRNALPALIKGAVCGLCVMPAEGVNRTISPTKLMEYLQFECPAVAAAGIREQDEIVQASQGGLLVRFDVAAIADAVQTLVEQPHTREAMGRSGRQYIEAFRDYSIFAQRLCEIVTRLAAPSAQ